MFVWDKWRSRQIFLQSDALTVVNHWLFSSKVIFLQGQTYFHRISEITFIYNNQEMSRQGNTIIYTCAYLWLVSFSFCLTNSLTRLKLVLSCSSRCYGTEPDTMWLGSKLLNHTFTLARRYIAAKIFSFKNNFDTSRNTSVYIKLSSFFIFFNTNHVIVECYLPS